MSNEKKDNFKSASQKVFEYFFLPKDRRNKIFLDLNGLLSHVGLGSFTQVAKTSTFAKVFWKLKFILKNLERES